MAQPYIVRLEHLGYEWWWTDSSRGRGSVVEWLQRCRSRASYRAIADYLDSGYLELMARTGAAERTRVAAILAAR